MNIEQKNLDELTKYWAKHPRQAQLRPEQLQRLIGLLVACDAELFKAENDIQGWQGSIARNQSRPDYVLALERAVIKRRQDIEAMKARKQRLIEDSCTWQN